MSRAVAVFDEVTLICKACGRERVFYPDAPLLGAESLILWMNTKATPCSCGARICDVKAHVRDAPAVVP